MSMRYQAGVLTASYFPLKTPNAPTIGTATAGDSSASVAFTAPSNVGGGAITGYVVVASPDGAFGSGSSSPITVSGLTNGTAYTFQVYAINAYGSGPLSVASNSATPAAAPQVAYTTPGTYTWVAPSGLSPATVSVVMIGGGGGANSTGGNGGGGGALGYKNGISVTGGSSYTVVVGAGGVGVNGASSVGGTGGTSSFTAGATTYSAAGGTGGSNGSPVVNGGTRSVNCDGGGNGGMTSVASTQGWAGGAGGYAGNGGGIDNSGNIQTPSGGAGGGGSYPWNGGGAACAGAGVGLLGQGTSGSNATTTPTVSTGGSGGANGVGSVASVSGGAGGAYGGGGGWVTDVAGGSGGGGAVRIIYSFSGTTRSFPSTNTGNL